MDGEKDIASVVSRRQCFEDWSGADERLAIVFAQLTRRAQLQRLRSAARAVLAGYGMRDTHLELLKYEDNAVYRAATPHGDQFVLRLEKRIDSPYRLGRVHCVLSDVRRRSLYGQAHIGS